MGQLAEKFGIRSAVIPIVVITSIFFVLQIVMGSNFTNLFLLASEDVFTRPWILVTHMLVHGSSYHLIFNMWALFLFGILLEQRIGPKRFLLFYLSAGIIAGFISSFFYERALGASGAIMGIIGALIILMPELQLLMFYVVPMPLWLAGIFYALIDIFGILFPSGVGNIAHLAGMATGLLYGIKLKKEKKRFYRKIASKTHLDDEDMEDYLKTGRI